MADKLSKTDEEWKRQLTDEQYGVCRMKGTERAFTGIYWDCKDEGVYRCSCCDNPLFSSESKFNSGTGWPSFSEPVQADTVKTESDNSLLMKRREVLCSRCGAHLGHVFEDGPNPTRLRYCINSVSLKLDKK